MVTGKVERSVVIFVEVEVYVYFRDLNFCQAYYVKFFPGKVVNDCLRFAQVGSCGLHVEMGNPQTTF